MTGTQEAEVRRDHSKLLEAFIELGNEVLGLREEYRKALEQVDAVRITLASVQRERDEARLERDAANDRADHLQDFKAYVHRRLDEAGIPKMPNGPHSAEGCRIGDRLDIALSVLAPNTSHPPSCPVCDSEQCERGGR